MHQAMLCQFSVCGWLGSNDPKSLHGQSTSAIVPILPPRGRSLTFAAIRIDHDLHADGLPNLTEPISSPTFELGERLIHSNEN